MLIVHSQSENDKANLVQYLRLKEYSFQIDIAVETESIDEITDTAVHD